MEPTFDELRDLDQECEELEHSLTKLQEELEAASTNKRRVAEPEHTDEDSGGETRESSSNHMEHLLKDAAE